MKWNIKEVQLPWNNTPIPRDPDERGSSQTLFLIFVLVFLIPPSLVIFYSRFRLASVSNSLAFVSFSTWVCFISALDSNIRLLMRCLGFDIEKLARKVHFKTSLLGTVFIKNVHMWCENQQERGVGGGGVGADGLGQMDKTVGWTNIQSGRKKRKNTFVWFWLIDFYFNCQVPVIQLHINQLSFPNFYTRMWLLTKKKKVGISLLVQTHPSEFAVR